MRAALGTDGRFKPERPAGLSPEGAAAYREIAGRTSKQAQKIVVEQLHATGEIEGDPRPITHMVRFYERGERPLEIVTSRQWYLRNGGRDLELRAELLALGRELRWHPANMRARYDSWLEGLKSDWLMSRQRYLAVPVPIWHLRERDGNPVSDDPRFPAEYGLPAPPSPSRRA